ncbi:MAG: type II toxin-antitoxin system VapC family toxin, partial [Nitrososphaerota archaeon]|nr:type II toxin-antitoxin system VapC family toxin [Nitrososphaerota archaeon]
PLDVSSSDKAGKILADLAKEGGLIDFRDALIAGISVANSLLIMTRNKDHFSRIKGLKVESW